MKFYVYNNFWACAGVMVLEYTWSSVTGMQTGARTMYAGGIRYLHWVVHLLLHLTSVAAGLRGGILNFQSLVDRLDLLL